MNRPFKTAATDMEDHKISSAKPVPCNTVQSLRLPCVSHSSLQVSQNISAFSTIALWLYGNTEGMSEVGDTAQPRKRPCVDNPAPTTSKCESIAKTISTVEAIVGKLCERHGDAGFSVEQFKCWAHMINSV